MRVRDMIEMLVKQDPDALVVVDGCAGETWEVLRAEEGFVWLSMEFREGWVEQRHFAAVPRMRQLPAEARVVQSAVMLRASES